MVVSGPVSTVDVEPEPRSGHAERCELEIFEGREAQVGSFRVHRVLPRRSRRTVGAWCFMDHMGPGRVTGSRGLDVGPHPHTGLQTVTWLLAGEVLHRDSLGSEQVIRPGQLNLMTAGDGVSHSEETRGLYEGELHGVQLWVAQPDATRAGAPAFEHHPELPRVELGHGTATVLVGGLPGAPGGPGAVSPARRDTDHVGVDLDLRAGRSTMALAPSHEYAVSVLEGSVGVRGHRLEPGRLGYLGIGHDELTVDATAGARVLLVGGEPFAEEVVMWWNYVARSRDEITAAHRSWTADDGRFGGVASPLGRIATSGPPWAR